MMGKAYLIKIILAGALAIISVSLVVLIFLLKFQPQSVFIIELRKNILHYPQLVKLVGLNQPGDIFAEYLSPKTNTIQVYMLSQSDMAPSAEASEWIGKMIRETTGKEAVTTYITDVPIQNKEAFADADLNAIRKTALRKSALPAVYIIYLSASVENPGYAGAAQHRDTLFVFQQTIQSLSDFANVQKRIEQSTLEHEWGHLLGLRHTELANCIMSEAVEVYTNRVNQMANIPIEHCWNSLYELEQRKKELR